MAINSKIKEEDFLDDKNFFYSEEETQSNINYLKKNLTEKVYIHNYLIILILKK